MRSLLVCLLGLCMTGGTAQSWCAPGAQWFHDYAYTSWGDVGYVETHYAGDVLFADSLCQELVATEHIYSYQSDNVSVTGPFSFYTTSAPGIVHVWTGSEFDTLYHFSAVPGDHWRFPASWPDEGTRIAVTDTGHAAIDGQLLRYVAVEATIGDLVLVVDTLFERIGPMHMYLNIPYSYYFLIDGGYGALRCYSDEEINITRVESSCEIALSIGSPDMIGTLEVFPNPANDKVQLRWKGDHIPTHSILRDISGRSIRSWPMAGAINKTAWISLEGLGDGQYFLQTTFNNGVQQIPLIIAH